jgi:hypothetical protein
MNYDPGWLNQRVKIMNRSKIGIDNLGYSVIEKLY